MSCEKYSRPLELTDLLTGWLDGLSCYFAFGCIVNYFTSFKKVWLLVLNIHKCEVVMEVIVGTIPLGYWAIIAVLEVFWIFKGVLR